MSLADQLMLCPSCGGDAPVTYVPKELALKIQAELQQLTAERDLAESTVKTLADKIAAQESNRSSWDEDC